MSDTTQRPNPTSGDTLANARAAKRDNSSVQFKALFKTRATRDVSSSDFVGAANNTIAAKQAKSSTDSSTLGICKAPHTSNPSSLADAPKKGQAAKTVSPSAVADMQHNERVAHDTTPSTVGEPLGNHKAARRPSAPAAVDVASSEKVTKQADPSEPADKSDNEKAASAEVEILDLPDSGLPNWKSPQIIDALLETGDERERRLVECILQYQWELSVQLVGALEAERAIDAVREFAGARDLTRIVIKTIENLVRHRKGGVQKVITLHASGPRIGLGAKVEELRRPKKGSPEARLVERVEQMEAVFDEAASRFHQNACGLRVKIRNVDTLGVPVEWVKNLKRWEDLRLKALQVMTVISDLVNRLECGGRQVVVTQHELFQAEDESERDDEQTSVVEHDRESAKPRHTLSDAN